MPRIPLVDDLIAGTIPPGSNILVEFDSGSQWYNASLTMGAGWLKSGGFLDYNVTAQPAANVRSKLKRLGLDVDLLEKEGKFELTDWYTATLGKKSSEGSAFDSLKVADLSINISKFGELSESARSAWLGIRDNSSTLARFNDEKAWVEFEVTRRFR